MMNACDRAFQWPMALHLLREMSHQRLQGRLLSMGRWDRDLVLVGSMDPFNGWKLLTRGGYFVIFCGGPGETICFIWLVWPSNRWQFIDSMVFLWLKIGKLCQDTVFFLITITLHLHAFAQMVCVLCQQFRRVHHLQKGWTGHRLLLATNPKIAFVMSMMVGEVGQLQHLGCYIHDTHPEFWRVTWNYHEEYCIPILNIIISSLGMSLSWPCPPKCSMHHSTKKNLVQQKM